MKRIVVATDFNELASAATRFAGALARSAGAELIVMYADTFEPPPEFTSSQIDELTETLKRSQRLARQELERCAAQYVPEGVKWRSLVAEGTPAAAIRRVAFEQGADIIAIGTHGRGGLQRLVLGSVAEHVMRETSVPVLTVRTADNPTTIRRIAISDTAGAEKALELGLAIATAVGAEPVRLSVQSPLEMLEIADDRSYDLIVVGGEQKLLWRIARLARTPVLSVSTSMPD